MNLDEIKNKFNLNSQQARLIGILLNGGGIISFQRFDSSPLSMLFDGTGCPPETIPHESMELFAKLKLISLNLCLAPNVKHYDMSQWLAANFSKDEDNEK